MTRIVTFLLLISAFTGVSQDSLNMKKLSVWTSPDAYEYNDCWGYTDPAGNEYAILGSNWGIHFLNVTDPTNPIEVGSFEGQNNDVIWRDMKVYGTTAYAVADQYSFQNAALSIFDLSDLPNSVTMVVQDDSYSQACHNIFIDGDLLYMCSNEDSNFERWALEVFTLAADPFDPLPVISMDDSWFGSSGELVHDIYVRNDTAYISVGFAGLYIYDFTDPSNPAFINSVTTYTGQGYNHSSWVHPDRHTMVMADEVPNSLPLKSFDVTDIENITSAPTTFVSNTGARPHNPFFAYNDVVVSYYLDGIQIFDFTDPSNPVRTAFYDTYPNNDTLSNPYPDIFEGAWGTYPFFQSGNIVGSDISYGLFMLTKITDVATDERSIHVCDNTSQSVTIDFTAKGTFTAGNKFYLEMASNGSFINAARIDSLAATAAGSYSFTFDPSTQTGTNFRFRISASAPQVAQSSWITVRYLQTPATPVITENAQGVLSSSVSAEHYQWFVNGTAIPSATEQLYTPTSDGAYTVEVSNGSCNAVSAAYDYTLSINDPMALRGVKLFPNPSSGLVNLYNPSFKALNVTLYGAKGEVVQQLATSAKMTQLEVQPGMYVVKMQHGETVAHQKLVVY